MTTFKRGYDFTDYPNMQLEAIGEEEDEGEASISIAGIKADGYTTPDYGATVIVKGQRIVAFRIKSYDIELEIPATIHAHNAIQRALSKL